MKHLSPFPTLFKQAVGRYAERPFYFATLGALSGLIPTVVITLGLFPTVLGIYSERFGAVSPGLMQASALLLTAILLTPVQCALAFAATNKYDWSTALKYGVIHSPKWLLTYLLTALALVVPAVLIAPGAFLGSRLAFVLPANASDKRFGFDAMRSSNDAVRGYTFPTMIFLLGFGIFAASLNVPMVLIRNSAINQAMLFFVNSIIVAPLFIIFLQVLFEDLRRVNRNKSTQKRGYLLHKLLVALGSIMFILALFKAAL